MTHRKFSIRSKLCGGAAISAIALAAPGALAQEPIETAQPEAQTGPVETIQVTGSRIQRDPNLASPVPVQSLDAESLQLSGQTSLSDTINQIPALLASGTAENSTGGGSSLNLRGLGATRTLTLVNGRRWVGGAEGSQSVDINAIPRPLIERVEVLTGGASAVYGSDAVTGVVNFILRDDYEGTNVDARVGISSEWDAETASLQFLHGRNFAQGRGNFTIAADFSSTAVLTMSQRDWAANNRIASNLANPDLRFQHGDISASATPLFHQFYNLNRNVYPAAGVIPSAEAFINNYNNAFGANLTTADLSSAELELINRAANAPAQALLPFRTFSISSKMGLIAPGNFGRAPGIDLDGDGVDDCRQSSVGWNSGSGFGGCWVVNPDGTLRPYDDGLIATPFYHFGGDGIEINFSEEYLLPQIDQANLNFRGRYDITPNVRVFGDIGYSLSISNYRTPYNGFFDLNYGAPDNPYLPEQLQAQAQEWGGLWINRDNVDSMGVNRDTTEREVIRFVGGFEGEFDNGWSWEIAGNYGRSVRTTTDRNKILLDRWFAAIDAVEGPDGTPVCRSDLDPTAVPPPNAFNEFPEWPEPGFWTFTPGDGQCQPANIWGGQHSISQDAIDFISVTAVDELTVEQTVFSAILVGDSDQWFSLPAGPIGFALGAEYRREESQNRRNPWDLGLTPAGSPAGEGVYIGDISDNEALGFFSNAAFFNSGGSYEVVDLFAEIQVPLLADLPFAEELSFDAAYRYADYNTIGGAETWKVGLLWTPIQDISFRSTLSQAIRAPNIDELFRPQGFARFGPQDPCDPGQIAAATNPQLRADNCRSGGGGFPGLDVDGDPPFTNPNTAAFVGATGGNPNLTEETADTLTIGLVFTPRFVQGFTFTVDYWDVEIKDGISSVGAQDIVNICYDSADFPNNPFCELFTRGANGGLNYLLQSFVNFANIEARGYDFAASYRFSWRENDFSVGLSGTHQERLTFFSNPSDLSEQTVMLERLQRPKWAGSANAAWTNGPLTLGWQTQYMSKQGASAAVDPLTAEAQFGDAAYVGEVFIHNLTGSYQLFDNTRVYGGVNNVENRAPFASQTAWPVGPRGRFFFLGVDVSF